MKVEGFFAGIKNANEAVQKLKSSGFNNAIVDLNDHFDISSAREQRATDSRRNPTLSSLIFTSGGSFDDETPSPFAAASPMASGMGNFEEIMDINYKVTLDVDENQLKSATNILKECGADLNSPNFDMHKHIRDIHL